MSNNNWVIVFTANGMLDAEIIRLFLESLSIPSIISQESAGITFGFTIGPLGEAKIFVKEENLQRAKEALKMYEDGNLNSVDNDEYPGDLGSYEDTAI